MRPGYNLIIGGEDRTADVTGRAAILEWTDAVTEESDALTITLQDSDNLLAVPKSGARIELAVGYDGRLERVGSFAVESTEIEGPPDRLTVSATAAPIAQETSIADRRSQTWEDTTIGEIADTIARRLKVEPVIDKDLAAVEIENEQQTDESDTNFLLRIVRREGGYLKFADGRLVIAKEGRGVGAAGAELLVTLPKSQVTTWRVQAGGKTAAIKKVKVKYHDYEAGETKEVEAEVEQTEETGPIDDSAWLAASESTFVPPTVAASEPEAKAQAKTLTQRIKRATRTLELTLPGRLDIIAGGKVHLTGFREGVAGEWLVKTVRHRIDSGGWSMQVTGEGV